ncbi:cysteinyl-tRNA synthetase [Archaeoglobus sulfaticallidus PM70-1]|uniref:Cysteine--tRNA ligase n=1 Tax=Archaeoglobus sulfaticallidus PM70-1 TaxID=387631 RepID=N0B9U0_9EURY|nr:cysteinyl-tRNA synthetase [Archaeoglobus sulfaticallidus PM70-1]
MALRMYNTFTKQEEELKLSDTVKIYVCGITAYDYSHIGHARSAVVFDTLRRYLMYLGKRVVYVQNFTDVDDKIIRRAVSEGKTQKEIAERFIEEYLKDMAELNVIPADYHPKVTENIPDIIAAVKKIIEKGYAYEVGDNNKDVYFHVPSFSEYGKLSGMSLEELNKHRIEPDPRKKDVKDFALWKAAKEEDIKAESVFDSPWGKGRPGWHIECSVLATKFLGAPFDIHGGGKDLIFPHHENERAQSYALFDVEPVRYWIHNDFVTINGEKMSKSLGNIIKIRDVIEKYGGEVLRYFLLSAHYRSSLDYSEKAMERASKSYESLKNALENLDMEISALKTFESYSKNCGAEEEKEIREFEIRFREAMDDDLNTPKVLAILHEFSTYINNLVTRCQSIDTLETAFETFKRVCGVLGLFEKYERVPELKEFVDLIREREQARKEKNFRRADEIRDLLKERGIHLIDTPRGTRWKTDRSYRGNG